MRIIPEWKDYDAEIKKLFENYEKQKDIAAQTQNKNTGIAFQNFYWKCFIF